MRPFSSKMASTLRTSVLGPATTPYPSTKHGTEDGHNLAPLQFQTLRYAAPTIREGQEDPLAGSHTPKLNSPLYAISMGAGMYNKDTFYCYTIYFNEYI